MIYTNIVRKPRTKLILRDSQSEREAEDLIIEQAQNVLLRRLGKRGATMGSPSTVRDYLRLTLATLEREEFWCIWLDAQNRVISADQCFVGTLNQTSVYPREIVKDGLTKNAAAVIFAHNHPSGAADPSHADQMLTQSLKQALALVDVKVLDHFIVAGNVVISFAERGLI